MSNQEIQQGIEAMQQIQRANPPSSEKWQRASTNLRKLVAMLNGKQITPEMWERGEVR